MTTLEAADQVTQFLEQGYLIIENFLPPEDLAATQEAVATFAPSWEDNVRDPAVHPLPSRLVSEFPAFPATIQRNIVRPDLLQLIEGAIGTTDIRLSVSFLWLRYARAGFDEQELHSDLQNQTLVFSCDDGPYRQVEGALYYTDVTEELCPTCVLPRTVDELAPGGPFYRPRSEYPELYEHEIKVAVPAGSLLLYGLSTLHRGGALETADGMRVSHHFCFRSAAVDWGQWSGWAKYAKRPEMVQFLTEATPRQRHLLGFPLPGDPYWTADMIQGVATRYPDMDLTPYAEALGA